MKHPSNEVQSTEKNIQTNETFSLRNVTYTRKEKGIKNVNKYIMKYIDACCAIIIDYFFLALSRNGFFPRYISSKFSSINLAFIFSFRLIEIISPIKNMSEISIDVPARTARILTKYL